MKRPNIRQIVGFPKQAAAAFCLAMATQPALAQGLTRATEASNSFLTDLKVLVPVLATIALIVIGLLYAKRIVSKEFFWNWAVGIVIGGSAAQLVSVFWGS